MAKNPLDPHPDVDNDGLSLSQTVDRSTWGLPSDEGAIGQGEAAHLPPAGFDYSGGVLVAPPSDADAVAPPAHPHLIRGRVDAPSSYDLPHEATHRRYEAPRFVGIAQSAIGTLMFAQPRIGLHYVKLLALCVSVAANGTLKLVQGSPDGLNVGPLGDSGVDPGALNMLAGTPLILPPAELANPWAWTAPDQALGLITTGAGAFANGWAIVAYSPYDS